MPTLLLIVIGDHNDPGTGAASLAVDPSLVEVLGLELLLRCGLT